MTRQQPFILSGYRGAPTEGVLTIQVFDRAARWRRALTGLGKWVGVALVAVFVPVAHFVLVPSFALYGVWEFAQRLGTAELPAAGRGTCPDCGREQPLDLAQRWYAPQPVSCRYCQRGLRLSIPR